jgi:hypothetical protein
VPLGAQLEQELTLLSPEHGDIERDIERDAVADAWVRGGGTVLRVGRFWDPPAVDPKRTRVYGNDTFCLVRAQKLGLELVSPPDDLLGRLEPALVGRHRVRAAQVVHRSGLRVSTGSARRSPLEQETLVLASEIVVFTAEVRAFVLDGEVVTLAAYEGRDVAVDDALSFASRVAATGLLPSTCVLDVGPIHGRSWAVFEANANWGAGLNGGRSGRVTPLDGRGRRPVGDHPIRCKLEQPRRTDGRLQRCKARASAPRYQPDHRIPISCCLCAVTLLQQSHPPGTPRDSPALKTRTIPTGCGPRPRHHCGNPHPVGRASSPW